MTQDVFQLVQSTADIAQFHEYLVAHRRSLLGQAKALEQQRAAVLQEADWIAKVTGPKIVKSSPQENS